MRRRNSKVFQLLCGLLTVAAVVLIGSNVAVIAFRGLKCLPECFFKKETLFAVGLSVKSASISTLACFLLAIPTSYTLTRSRIPCRTLAEMILELTMSLPYIVIGLSLLIFFSSPFGKWLKANGFPVVFSTNLLMISAISLTVANGLTRADRKRSRYE